MNTTQDRAVETTPNVLNLISWLFGIVVLAIGIVNTAWGNDTEFGIFIILCSFVYFLPVNIILRKITGFSIPKIWVLKILLAIFILWAAMGVGELFAKIEMMKNDL